MKKVPVKIVMKDSGFNESEVDVSHMKLSDAYTLLAVLLKRSSGTGDLITS